MSRNHNRIGERSRIRFQHWFLALLIAGLAVGSSEAQSSKRITLRIPSKAGAMLQPIAVTEPPGFEVTKTFPLLVSLHTWSGNWQQRNPELEAAASEREWLVVQPNFHGPNRQPLACGSHEAQIQILEAVQWCCEHYPVDRRRIYLTGVSGGGHMTLLMAGRYPHVWAAASAWVGISDLKKWHQFHDAKGGRYANDVVESCGGRPGASKAVDGEYFFRSPLPFLAAATHLPLDIAAGIHDGHTGSVPVSHSLEAFNEIARANGDPGFTPQEIEAWCKRMLEPAHEPMEDPVWKRDVHLRRRSGEARVTLFEGGHEGLATAAMDFLSKHRKEQPTEFDKRTLSPSPASGEMRHTK